MERYQIQPAKRTPGSRTEFHIGIYDGKQFLIPYFLMGRDGEEYVYRTYYVEEARMMVALLKHNYLTTKNG